MASLAGMLRRVGITSLGRIGTMYPPMSTLHALGIQVSQGFKSENLTPAPDCVIVGNAIPRGNPEVEETLKQLLTDLKLKF
jgi:UDP-N-acetylmuramate: L-alanyl-gamma-D-glutamyl-meso-diaminopimelate ligase